MISNTAADPGLLTTPPCTPLVSASDLAAGFGPQQLPSRDTTAAAAAATEAPSTDVQGTVEPSRGVDGYAEGLVRLKSFPLADAPTSVTSSSNSRRNSAEWAAAQGTPAAAAAAAAVSPKEPTVHAALPVPAAAAGASVSPLRQPAAGPTTPTASPAAAAAAAAKDGGATGGVSPRGVPASSAAADSAAQAGSGMRFSEDSLTGELFLGPGSRPSSSHALLLGFCSCVHLLSCLAAQRKVV
jgi:hypothetical protein